jgi:Holliday junction resolvase RusA-like endonuclease
MYIIPGDPVPLARARIGHGAKRMYDSQKELKMHAGIIVNSQHKSDTFLEGPLHLDVTFFMRIPRKIHTKRNLERTHTYHYCRPDLSNLIKFVEDAVQSILFHDDAQICCITARKIYHQEPRTEFTLKQLHKNEKYQ